MLELLAVALALGFLGLLLIIVSTRRRASLGFTSGNTFALDDVTLRSERPKLVGRPDRVVRTGKYLIPEEWKSAKRVSHGHRLQVIAYCLLIEERYGMRPPYGVVVNDGDRVVVRNTEELRLEVMAIAEEIRKRRRLLGEEIEVRQPLAKCRACGHRGNCGQASRYWQGEQLLRTLGRKASHWRGVPTLHNLMSSVRRDPHVPRGCRPNRCGT